MHRTARSAAPALKAPAAAGAAPRRAHETKLTPHLPLPAAESDAEAEVALITRAQAALDRDPRAALELLTQHEQQFPRGLLSEERDTLRIDAERALGLDARALTHARAFVQKYAASSQRRRLEQWLANRAVSAPLDRSHKNARGSLPTPD